MKREGAIASSCLKYVSLPWAFSKNIVEAVNHYKTKATSRSTANCEVFYASQCRINGGEDAPATIGEDYTDIDKFARNLSTARLILYDYRLAVYCY
jgi:hypothetical protein